MRNNLSRPRRNPLARRPTPRGFTLIELVVSIVILSVTCVAMLRFGGMFSRSNADATARADAARIASSRLETIRSAATYAAIDGYAETNTIPTGFAAFKRTTVITRVGGTAATDTLDYKIITTTVTSQRLTSSVSKTTAISAN